MFGFDTETYLFDRDIKAPRLVCLSLFSPDTDVPEEWRSNRAYAAVRETDEGWTAVLRRDLAVEVWPEVLQADVIVGHNVAYDLAVLAEACRRSGELWTPDVMRDTLRALDRGAFFDTGIREKLIRNAFGEFEWYNGHKNTYSLAELVERYYQISMTGKHGEDVWRLRYAELDGVPMDRWPAEAIEYAMLDAKYPPEVADAQIVGNPPLAGGYMVHDGEGAVVSEAREVAADFALHLMACWGLRTDPDAVAACLAEWREESKKGRDIGREHGWIRVKGRDKGKPDTVDTKVLRTKISDAYRAKGLPAPKTKPSKTFPQGQIKVDEETLTNTDDPVLVAYADSLQATNWLTKYGEPLLWGLTGPLTSSPNVLVESGRTSWSDPALQQPPRKGPYRGCHVPRRGWVYCTADYDAMELGTLAQVCLWTVGQSVLAETINEGQDPHIITAMAILDAEGHPDRPLSYAEAIERKNAGEPIVTDARQKAKPINFGFPGMMGVDTFVEYARVQYGVRFTPTKATELKRVWMDRYPEMPGYFGWVQRTLGGGRTIQQFVSERVRGGVRAPAAANTLFQGLGADGAKYAAWVMAMGAYGGIAPADAPPEIVEACRVFEGARPVLFLHDEILCELPENRAAEMAAAQSAIMVWAMERHTPDVTARATPVLMRRWIKGAKPRFLDGRLVPVEK